MIFQYTSSTRQIVTGLQADVLALESEWSEIELTLVENNIDNLFSTPFELLPKAGAGNYYVVDFNKSVIEYNAGAIAYTLGGIQFIQLKQGSAIGNALPAILAAGTDEVVGFYPTGTSFKLDEKLTLSTTIENPKDGDGTLKVKLYYKIVTFG